MSKGGANRAQSGKNTALSLAFRDCFPCYTPKTCATHSHSSEGHGGRTTVGSGVVGTHEEKMSPPDLLPHIP